MRTFFSYSLFRGLLFSVFVSVGLLVVGCDSGGSNGNDGPAWTGNWEVQDAGPDFYSITTEEVQIIEERSVGTVCETEEITNIDGNEITTNTGTVTAEVSDGGDTLTLDGIDGGTVTAERVDSVPDCPDL